MHPHFTPTKICTKCKEAKPATNEYFARAKREPDGFTYWCKICDAAYRASHKEEERQRSRAYYEANKDRILQRNREYRQRNKEYLQALNRKYYQVHKDKWKRYALARRDHINRLRRIHAFKNREKFRLQGRLRYQRDAEKIRFRARQQERRRFNAPGNHTLDDIKRQYKAQKGRCYYCHNHVGDTYHVDHVIPLSRGGSNDPENLVIACPTCNLRKNDRLPHEWSEGGRLL